MAASSSGPENLSVILLHPPGTFTAPHLLQERIVTGEETSIRGWSLL